VMRLQNTPPAGAGKAQGVTKTELLLRNIRGLGTDANMKPIGIRTGALVEATGVPAKSIQQLLDQHVENGALVVCKITGPTGHQEREYRAGPGVAPPEFVPLNTRRSGVALRTTPRPATSGPTPLSTPKPDVAQIVTPTLIKPTQPEVVEPAEKTPAAGGATNPPAAEPAVAAHATPGPTPRAALKKEPVAVKAPAGDVRRQYSSAIDITIDQRGTLTIGTVEDIIELDSAQVLALGDFLHATQGVWRP
jgi:hypothetical protein